MVARLLFWLLWVSVVIETRLRLLILIPFKYNYDMIIIFRYSLFSQDIRRMDLNGLLCKIVNPVKS